MVVTNGAEGVYVSDGVTIYFHKPFPTPIATTVGAGDAFGSAFSGYLIKKRSIIHAIQAGMINSASVIQHIDTQSGLCSYKKIDAYIEEIHNKSDTLLQQYALKQ